MRALPTLFYHKCKQAKTNSANKWPNDNYPTDGDQRPHKRLFDEITRPNDMASSMHHSTSEEAATKGCEFWRRTCDHRRVGRHRVCDVRCRRRDQRFCCKRRFRHGLRLKVLLVCQKFGTFDRTFSERNQVHHLLRNPSIAPSPASCVSAFCKFRFQICAFAEQP